ncbi:oxidoreductase [Erwiniaceae bacterium BAC15a-03b]|uniref:Oxidoreductase n=1 Tax=Winslowiella arboricola TaxID=2978220 RepID=A0A9J6PXB8_9GAMM|nr:oxidoreductase [Winslowiella arboricola]MCU5775658.1 oxidoreductase [Winslowiella arboricola]MCU5779492.1 oxidoreductase [Winslowiella arboricola]
MEQRRYPGNNHWYHETQSSVCAEQESPLVPEAAEIEDRFLLGLMQQATGALLKTLQSQRPALQASRDLSKILLPDTLNTSLTHTLTLYDRLCTALTVAQVTGVQSLCNHYAARLNPLPGPDSSRESNNRLTQITQYSRQLASEPTLIDSAALRRLEEVGLTDPDIITFSQLIGFVSYQARVVAGIQALMALPVRWIPGITTPADADAARFSAPPQWQPQLPPVELRYASAEQLEVLTYCQTQQSLEHSAWLFAHDARALYGWSQLLASLQQQQTEQDRLAAAVTARINGSVSCFYDYQGEWRDVLIEGIDEALAASKSQPQAHAIIQAAAQLTRSPERFSAAHLQPLEEAGLSSAAQFRLIQNVAFASWNNRLMQTLGS